MYECMYECMYVCMYLCMYVCMYACMFVGMHVCICVHMYMCIYVNICTCVPFPSLRAPQSQCCSVCVQCPCIGVRSPIKLLRVLVQGDGARPSGGKKSSSGSQHEHRTDTNPLVLFNLQMRQRPFRTCVPWWICFPLPVAEQPSKITLDRFGSAWNFVRVKSGPKGI